MKSKFRFINDTFEMPMLNYNEEWCTNTWVYCIVGVLGAISGISVIREFFMGASAGEAISVSLVWGMYVTLAVWAGCTAMAFMAIPETKFAIRRSIFNLIAVALVFYICAALSIIALILVTIMIVGLILAAGGSGKSSRRGSAFGESSNVTDEHGNVHYVSSELDNNRVLTTDGETMRRGADGTWRRL